MLYRRNDPTVITFKDRRVECRGKLQISDVLQKADWPYNTEYTLIHSGKTALLFPEKVHIRAQNTQHIEHVVIDEFGLLAPSYKMLVFLDWKFGDTIRVYYIKGQVAVLYKVEYFFDDDDEE